MGRNPHRPNYKRMYPNTIITPDVMEALTQTDRAIEYGEYDRKQETFVVDQEAEIAYLSPAREDSYDRLMEEQHIEFQAPGSCFEDALMAKITVDELLSRLPAEESALIQAIYLKGLTEEEYSRITGVSRSAVGKHKRRILCSLCYSSSGRYSIISVSSQSSILHSASNVFVDTDWFAFSLRTVELLISPFTCNV